MNELIKVGDEIKNWQDDVVKVVGVTNGKHGALVSGAFDDGQPFDAFVPWELPALDETSNWYGWTRKSHFTLPSGIKVGCLSWPGNDIHALDVLDSRYEHTLELIRKEQEDDRNMAIS